jgi:hypothetical protein
MEKKSLEGQAILEIKALLYNRHWLIGAFLGYSTLPFILPTAPFCGCLLHGVTTPKHTGRL